jgi:endonuclease YncB( thermonuclease family)
VLVTRAAAALDDIIVAAEGAGCEGAGGDMRVQIRRCRGFGLLAVAMLSAAAAAADLQPGSEVEGRVRRVIDGDTVDFAVPSGSLRVRLSEIDAPELAQPYGEASRLALVAMLDGRVARLVGVDRDRYGRSVADVYVDGASINALMVRRGHAWAYTQYARSLEIIERENEARAEGAGLWALPEAERDPPWEWRAARRRGGGKAAVPGHSLPFAGPVVCGSRTYCREMASCAEARAYLEQCGLKRLDGDGDGVPCESLCRDR